MLASALLLLLLSSDREADARSRRLPELKALVSAAGLTYPPAEVYLRVFKAERELEVWASPAPGQPYVRLWTTPVCAASGAPGPKRREGDLQVPEGLYRVSGFNPTSAYHLALKLDYPNASDRLRSDRAHPGGEIFLHGACASIGCIAVEDGPVELVYLLARAARRPPVAIDVFPFRLTGEGVAAGGAHRAFWAELLPVYQAFEATHRRPAVRVDPASGAYHLVPSARNP